MVSEIASAAEDGQRSSGEYGIEVKTYSSRPLKRDAMVARPVVVSLSKPAVVSVLFPL